MSEQGWAWFATGLTVASVVSNALWLLASWWTNRRWTRLLDEAIAEIRRRG